MSLRIIKDESVQGSRTVYRCFTCKAVFDDDGIKMHGHVCSEIVGHSRNVIAFVGAFNQKYANAERIYFDDWCDLYKIDGLVRERLRRVILMKTDIPIEARNRIPFWVHCLYEILGAFEL